MHSAHTRTSTAVGWPGSACLVAAPGDGDVAESFWHCVPHAAVQVQHDERQEQRHLQPAFSPWTTRRWHLADPGCLLALAPADRHELRAAASDTLAHLPWLGCSRPTDARYARDADSCATEVQVCVTKRQREKKNRPCSPPSGGDTRRIVVKVEGVHGPSVWKSPLRRLQ